MCSRGDNTSSQRAAQAHRADLFFWRYLCLGSLAISTYVGSSAFLAGLHSGAVIYALMGVGWAVMVMTYPPGLGKTDHFADSNGDEHGNDSEQE